MTPESRKWPIENAREPWHAGLLAGERRTPPLVAAIEEPDADRVELHGNCFDLTGVGRLRTLEPAPRSGIDQWQQRRRRTGQPVDAFVTQRTRARLAFDGVADQSAVADVDDRDWHKSRCRWRRHVTSHAGWPRCVQRYRAAHSLPPRSAFAPIRLGPAGIPGPTSRSRPGSRDLSTSHRKPPARSLSGPPEFRAARAANGRPRRRSHRRPIPAALPAWMPPRARSAPRAGRGAARPRIARAC